MHVQIDDQLLAEVSRKTGQSPDAILGELEVVAQAHLKRLLGQAEAATVPLDAFQKAGRQVASENGPLFRELAK